VLEVAALLHAHSFVYWSSCHCGVSAVEAFSRIRSFVKEVRVTGNKVLLNYTTPLPPKGLMIEQTTVLPTAEAEIHR